MKIAATDEARVDALAPLLEGPTAIAFGRGDEATTAKAVLEATRPFKVVKVKGAVLGQRTIDADGVQRLATLPSRDALLAGIIGAVVAPLATTAGLLEAPLRDMAGLIAALSEKKSAAA